MAPKRRGQFGGGNQGKKRKKFNLITLRQKQDFKQFGEAHPVNSNDTVKSYTKIPEEQQLKVEKETQESSSSDESEAETPALKELMAEIGMEEEEPESEQESEDDEDERTMDRLRENSSDGSGDEGNVDLGEIATEEENADDSDQGESTSDDDDDDDGDEEQPSREEIGAPTKKARKKEKFLPSGGNSSQSGEKPKSKEERSVDKKEEMIEDAKGDDADESEEESDDENEVYLKESDPFTKHFEHDRDMAHLFDDNSKKWSRQQMKIPGLGEASLIYKYAEELPEPDMNKDLIKQHVKKKLCEQIKNTNSELVSIKLKQGESLTPLQHRLFSAINAYQDILYPKQTHTNTEEIRLVYCLHALNHVLKTRSRVIAHNMKLKQGKKSTIDDDDDIEYRDQGLTRPKVLIILPYRDRALKVVNMMASLLSSTQQANVSNRKRFDGEFSELEESGLAEKSYKPDDFKKLFEGNTDDNFRIGMSVSKKNLRLYTPFYESDIILASPLGLRMIIGLEGDKERDFDFLSSVEVLITDQTDVYLMQNWDHFLHTCKHLHLQPRESHGVDFSRVRFWSINGWSKYFRQTLVFSSVLLPEIVTVFNKYCHNYTGKLMLQRSNLTGTIKFSLSDAPQIFHRVSCDTPDSLSQRKAKFEYFKRKIIPYHTSAGMKQTLVFCNYFSFVQLRNFFRETEVDFLFMNEYDTEQKMRNSRIHFRKRHPHFMLYTERLHFHYRFRLRGIHHIVWFDLPQYPVFYSEIVNLMETSRQACTTTALFTKYEAQRLAEVVGSRQSALMINSEKAVNMITIS